MIRMKLLSAGKALALGLFIAIAAALVVYLVFRNKHPQPDQARPKLQGKDSNDFSLELGASLIRLKVLISKDKVDNQGRGDGNEQTQRQSLAGR